MGAMPCAHDDGDILIYERSLVEAIIEHVPHAAVLWLGPDDAPALFLGFVNEAKGRRLVSLTPSSVRVLRTLRERQEVDGLLLGNAVNEDSPVFR